MKFKFDVEKAQDNSFILKLTFLVEPVPVTVSLPLGKDLAYAFYKGLDIEVKALDCLLNEFGKGQLSGAQEEANNAQESLSAQNNG